MFAYIFPDFINQGRHEVRDGIKIARTVGLDASGRAGIGVVSAEVCVSHYGHVHFSSFYSIW